MVRCLYSTGHLPKKSTGLPVRKKKRLYVFPVPGCPDKTTPPHAGSTARLQRRSPEWARGSKSMTFPANSWPSAMKDKRMKKEACPRHRPEIASVEKGRV
ncbi:hypothetical protein AB1N83_001769 [Pleurotus pulmonarius]